jgi:hypothetical protein
MNSLKFYLVEFHDVDFALNVCYNFRGVPQRKDKYMQVCFIGHRSVQNKGELISSLKETVIDLIGKGATTFLFGSMSDFDRLSWETVTALKANYPFIKRVYVPYR